MASNLKQTASSSATSSPYNQQVFVPPNSGTSPALTSTSRGRVYRSSASALGGGSTATRWVTREIAALDFLLGIPLEAEGTIVRAGLNAHRRIDSDRETREISKVAAENEPEDDSKEDSQTRWWEKIILKDKVLGSAEATRLEEEKELEKPETQIGIENSVGGGAMLGVYSSGTQKKNEMDPVLAAQRVAPGRRLDGREDIFIETIPEIRTMEKINQERTVAKNAKVREWKIRYAHGIGSGNNDAKGLLDGRAFFSSGRGYPVEVFSLVKYEPKKEEAARRRKKLEELGGGGSQFVIPKRDWRGVSYAGLLKKTEKKRRRFHRRRPKEHHTAGQEDAKTKQIEENESGHLSDRSLSSPSSEESDSYVPGFLDDPEMVQGRHRHVMVGDNVTGPIVSSVIQFVKPADLKADLNRQFRDRFDGWEPPKSRRKMIGAKVINGVYTLMDSTEVTPTLDEQVMDSSDHQAPGGSSDKETIRMPPSLTLSKIRSLKQQALLACVKANIEISTVAVACVYLERLCLDGRVDKSNRRLCFAVCLMLAYKMNEPNLAIDNNCEIESSKRNVLNSFVRPRKESIGVFASLLEFFTNEWSLSLKHLFAAEWGVLAALEFRLHATPSQVAFHFKRHMKVLERNTLSYLGEEMYNQWQMSLLAESIRRERREKRREVKIEQKERKLMELQRDLQMKQQNEAVSQHSTAYNESSELKGWGRRKRHHQPRNHSSEMGNYNSQTTISDAVEGGDSAKLSANTDASSIYSPCHKGEKILKKPSMWNRLLHQKRPSSSVGKDLDKLAVLEPIHVSNHQRMRRSASSPNVGKSFEDEDRKVQTRHEMVAIDIHQGDSPVLNLDQDSENHTDDDVQRGSDSEDYNGSIML